MSKMHDNEWEEVSVVDLKRRYSIDLPTAFRHAVVVRDHTGSEDKNGTVLDQRTVSSIDLLVRSNVLFRAPILGPMHNLSAKPNYLSGLRTGAKTQGNIFHSKRFSEKFKPEWSHYIREHVSAESCRKVLVHPEYTPRVVAGS